MCHTPDGFPIIHLQTPSHCTHWAIWAKARPTGPYGPRSPTTADISGTSLSPSTGPDKATGSAAWFRCHPKAVPQQERQAGRAVHPPGAEEAHRET